MKPSDIHAWDVAVLTRKTAMPIGTQVLVVLDEKKDIVATVTPMVNKTPADDARAMLIATIPNMRACLGATVALLEKILKTEEACAEDCKEMLDGIKECIALSEPPHNPSLN